MDIIRTARAGQRADTGLPAGRGRGRRRSRAQPLSPDERRAALMASTLPLLLTHGTNVTTRAIAAASGVAEGTIFRVFPDKDSLIRATVAAAMDPTPLLAELERVDINLPLDKRVAAIAEIMQRRLQQVFRLLGALGWTRPPDEFDRLHPSGRPINELVKAAVVRLLRPDRDRLRVSPAEAARMIRLVTFAGSHPLINDNKILTPTEIARLVLDGVRRHDSPEA